MIIFYWFWFGFTINFAFLFTGNLIEIYKIVYDFNIFQK